MINLKQFLFLLFTLCLSGGLQGMPIKHSQNKNYSNINPSAYVAAYPDHITGIEGDNLIWKDGSRMAIGTPAKLKTIKEALNNPDLYMQLYLPYPTGPQKTPPSKEFDPGRIRYVDFFKKMYGNTEEEVRKNLVEVEWLPRTFSGDSTVKLLVTKVNGVSDKIKKISAELDDLVQKKPHYKKYLKNPGGTFSWRLIAGTDRPSAHSFGMTIDINTDHSDYWLWDYKKKHGLSLEAEINESNLTDNDVPTYRNKIPLDIVAIFEKYNFIWGGKWFHYDTMHFEYRPELFIHH